MSYQLPPEVQTTKLNNLPQDIKFVAEELIAEKFGYGEVMEDKKSSFFDPAQTIREPMNTLLVILQFDGGRQYKLMQSLGHYTELRSYRATSYGRAAGSSALIDSIVRKLSDQISDCQRHYGRLSGGLILEMNGQRQIAHTLLDISNFITRYYEDRVNMDWNYL